MAAAAAREHLADTSSKLRLAFSDLHAINNQIEVLTAGVDGDSLSEAAARVQQAAEMAKSQASWVLKAAGAAEAAASKAVTIVAEAEAAQAAASKAAEAAARAEEVAAHAAQRAAKAGAAAAALMAAMGPPAPARRRARGGDGRHKSRGTKSPAKAAAVQSEVEVVVKAGDLEIGDDDQEYLEASSDRAAEADARNDELQREEGDE
ncbi:unnamed protein product, partial [Scytosiphon promiscuus]